jgi:hypothetical protein
MRDGKWTISTLLSSNANKNLAERIIQKNNDLLKQS